jgi:hypothetical protein
VSSRLGFRSSLLSALLLAAGLMLGAFVPRTEAQVSATGGTQRDYVYKGEIRRALVFTTAGSNTLSVSSGGAANVLVVAGGGGGGANVGGGGGAGGFVESNNFTLATGDYWVQVGGGGAGQLGDNTGGTGTNSFLTNSTSFVTAYGGGGGGRSAGKSGGSGGGGGTAAGGSASPAGQGNSGGDGNNYAAGGGGGAGSVGSNKVNATYGGAGGIGKQSTLGGPANGSMSWYAGGGGGCNNSDQSKGYAGAAGGLGGGGNGVVGQYEEYDRLPHDGQPNTGGGGGGRRDILSAGKGGSGIVIVDWVIATGAPDIENRPVSGVTASSATFNGYLVSTGSSDTAVSVLWGTNNGALAGSSWANTNAVPGTWANGSSPSIAISSLSQGYVYYYTFAASNALTNATAVEPVSFWYSNGIVQATGGTVTNYFEGVTNYRAHIFTTLTATSLTVTAGGYADVLVVGGGGGGGHNVGGGGGAGGFVTTNRFALYGGGWAVQVGDGGNGAAVGGPGTIGNASMFSNGTSFLVAKGGGGGGLGNNSATHTGASGGGGGNVTGYRGYLGQGNDGGNGNANAGGGGGGAGSVGSNKVSPSVGGAGGIGKQSAFSGSNTWYAGGGGGCSEYNSSTVTDGGLGGGGKGGWGNSPGVAATSGGSNTGGGGGGNRDKSPGGGKGGSGIVIVRYAVPSVIVTAPAMSQLFFTGSPITATAAVANASAPCTVRFYTNSLPAGAFGLAGEDSNPGDGYTAALGTPAVGGYSIYATASNAIDGLLTSPTISFSLMLPAKVVTNVTSPESDGAYKANDVIDVEVMFDGSVNVAGGTPQLKLETGATDQYATYSSGSGTTTLTFQYTVQAGDTSSDLTYTGITALETNGATIKDGSGYDALLTLPEPTAPGSLGANKALVIDTTAPTVTGVTSTKADGYYKAGEVIDITVTFNDVVTVSGTPRLTLETGSTDRDADCISGSGTATLTFRYTVQAGDTSSDLDYLSTTALALNGGTIRDATGNDATLTLPSPGAAGSLRANKALVIDTTAPTLNDIADNDADDSVHMASAVSYTLTFSEDMKIATIDVSDFENAADSTPVTFTVGTISEAPPAVTVPVTPRALGNLRLRVKSNATITDEAGNPVTVLPVTDDTTLAVTLPPIITPTDVGGTMGNMGRVEVNAINNSGIGAPTSGGYDTHSRSSDDCWMAAVTSGNMTYDLGAIYNITNMVLWNYDEGNALTNRGIKDFTIQYFDKTNGLISSSGLLTAQRADVTSLRIAAQVIDIPDASNVNKVKLCISNNWGEAGACGMAELKFEGTYVASWVNYTPLDLISPTGGVTTMGEYSATRAPSNSWTRSGLTPSTGPFRSTDIHQTVADGSMWESSAGTTIGTVTYAFSNVLEVSAVALWNFNEDWTISVKDFDIQFLDKNDVQFSSVDGLVARKCGYSPAGGEYVYDLKTGLGVLHGPLAQSPGAVAEVFSFTPVAGVKKVRLNIRSNYGSASYTGISEFGIVGRVKPPSGTLFLLR